MKGLAIKIYNYPVPSEFRIERVPSYIIAKQVILYQNGLIRLKYDPLTGVLCAVCPDIQQFSLLQVHAALDATAKAITSHGVELFLFDCRRTAVEVDDEDCKVIFDHLMEDLMTTPLRRVALVVSQESKVSKYAQGFEQGTDSTFALEKFSSLASAEMWLKS